MTVQKGVLYLFFCTAVYSQSQLEKDIFDHYKKFDINEIRTIEQSQDNPEKKQMLLQNLLNDFYKEHPLKPAPPDDINLEITLRKQDDPDYGTGLRRKSTIRNLTQKQTPHLIKEAPNIFELHYSMAHELNKPVKGRFLSNKNPYKASARYLAALGFRTLKLSPQIWTDPERLILQNNEKETKDAENYQKVSNDLVAVQKEYEETKRKLAIQQDNDAIKLNDPGNYPDYAANQKTLENIKTKIQALEVEMQKQTTIFHEYETQYNKESANFLIEFANNVKLIDKKIRDREKILNSIEYYRSNYDGTFQQTWKLESREMAYAGLLEMSCLLDPQNAKTPALLGEMYKNAGEDLLAISSLERSLKFNETSSLKFSDTELYEIYKNLGGLYYATRRYVDSAWYYEKVIAIKRSPDMEFQLAKIHTENTGNYERARELLGNLLLAYKQPVNTKLEDASVLDALKTRFQTLSFLVTIFEKTGPEKKLVDYLKQLLEIHASLEKMISDSYDNLRVDEKKMTDARIQLNQKPDQTSLQTFYTDQQKFRDQKEITQKMEALRKTLNLQKVYFTLAYQNEVQNDVAGAIEVYRRAESYGIDPDRARREIMRLQKK